MRMSRRKIHRLLLSSVLAGALGAVPGVGSAASGYYDGMYGYDTGSTGEPDEIDMLLDGVLVRPLMLLYTGVSTAAFVVTLPFSAIGGNAGDAAEKLVVGPARYTFARPLGDMTQAYAEPDPIADPKADAP